MQGKGRQGTRGTRAREGRGRKEAPPGPRPGDAHQREEVGVTVLEAGAVGGGVGVPVGGRGVAHGEGCLLGAVGGAVRAAVGRLRDLSMLL